MRDSNFELLRIIAMLAIIAYHLLSFFICKESDNPVYVALQLPLHIGVLLFVLISGYYGIRTSLKGICRLLLPLLFYYLPLELTHSLYCHDFGMAKNTLLILSSSPYWYIRTYLWLYLLSPVINNYLRDITGARRLYLLIVLGIISMYFGAVKGDSSLLRGTNVVNFMFLYTIGNTIRRYQERITLKTRSLMAVYITLNILIVVSCVMFSKISIITDVIFKTCFFYCSPGLILNAVLLFMIFMRIHFNSGFINKIASSTYSMYIIHHVPFLLYGVIGPVVLYICNFDLIFLTILMVALFSVIIMIISFLIDQTFRPVFNHISSYINKQLPFVANLIENANVK